MEAKNSSEKMQSNAGRYDVVALAIEWAKVLQKSDEGKNLSSSELVKKSLEEIRSGKVSEKEIQAALKAKAAAPAEEGEEKTGAAADEHEKGKKEEKESKKSKK